ncbi:MAG TPA: aldo/keto reductase [Nitrososphaeraceae archaeon]|jgi:diketogulonate reductase-like aldo/keto reductase|nr:aldo/keto reductase [Nitrososphaeraceae archaeon]
MIQRKFGWTGVDVPIIGQGTWMIDGDSEVELRALQTLRLGLDLGMNHIDTAEMYGEGHVEELVGEAIAGRRDEIFLVSKVLPSNASYDGTLKACERSLKRLKTDWLDLYLLHWRGSYPLSETMRAMEKLVAEGLVKYIGVSNFDVEDLVEAEQVLQTEQIACNQVLYNLRDRGIEPRLLPYCSKKRIAVVGYAPFGHGNFPSPSSREGKLLIEIGRRHNRTPKQVALTYLTRHPSTFTIPKTTRLERVKENSGGVGWQLTEDEVNMIDRAFPVPPPGTPLGVI